MNNRIFRLLSFLLIAVFISTACNFPVALTKSREEVHESGPWEYAPVFLEPISSEVDHEEVKLGDLVEDGVMVKFNEGAFELPVTVLLTTPDSVPEIYTDEFMPIGAPIEVTSNADQTRLDHYAFVCFSTDISVYDREFEYGEVYATYYNGEEWDYIRPTLLYLEEGEGVACFRTFHLSLFGWGAIDAEERMEKYTHNAALAGYIQDQIDDKLEETASKMVKHILTQNLGIDDDSLQEKVMSSLLLDDSWGDVVSHIKDGDPDAIEDIGLLAGRAIVMVVPDSTMKTALDKLTGDSGLSVAKVAMDVTRELADGNYSNAAKKIVEGIADQFIVTTMAKIVVDGVEASIQYWKNEEIEAAYEAYKNGANGYFYGYNVDAGDFDSIWLQMRGLARELELEAIEQQNEAREEIGYPLLTAEEELKIRDSVRLNLKNEFINRKKDEDEILRRKEEIKQLIELYDENSLLLSGVLGYRSEFEIEQRLDTLLHFKDKMMRDLGATELMDGVLLHNGKLGMDAVVRATLIYMEDGIEAYNEYIYETFEVELVGGEDIDSSPETEEPEENAQAQQVYASIEWDYIEMEVSRHSSYTFEFWDVGAAGGEEYSKAVMTYMTTDLQCEQYFNSPSDMGWRCESGGPQTATYEGTFSGGPDGILEFFDDGLKMMGDEFLGVQTGSYMSSWKLKVMNGAELVPQPHGEYGMSFWFRGLSSDPSIPIDNPDVFE